MTQWRKSRQTGRTDSNQPGIVKALRKIPGVTVEVGHDDILCGYKCRNYWYELKEPGTISTITGQVRPSEIKDSQKKLLKEWAGHYKIAWTLGQILEDMGFDKNHTKS